MSRWDWVLTMGLAALVIYAIAVLVLMVLGRREHVRALAGFIPDCLTLFRRLLGDRRVSLVGKFLLGGMILYLAMPFDVVPDFVPIAGQLDDAILVAVVLRFVLWSAGPDVVAEHWPGPKSSLNVVLHLAGQPPQRGG
jgi:uncharacterized membrane protein YkvA (DUF1232 family)